MGVILFLFYFIFAWMFLFGRVKVNDTYNITLWQRVIACLVISLVCTSILGLPLLIILGIISLFI